MLNFNHNQFIKLAKQAQASVSLHSKFSEPVQRTHLS
jgi:hypothetical protein